MIFCKIDNELVNLILSYAKGKTIVDVGCGEGELQRYMAEEMQLKDTVISLDIRGDITGDAPWVLKQDAIKFKYNSQLFPVVLRPCHSDFVSNLCDALKKQKIPGMLYISKPKNLPIDIPEKYVKKITINENWTGAEGERVYYVSLCKEELKEFILIYLHEENGRVDKKRLSWFQVDEKKERLYNIAGGYSPGTKEYYTIFKTVYAYSFAELDWNGTWLDVKDWEKTECGWLDRNGKFYECSYRDHDTLAFYLLKKEVSELEEEGWVRIDDSKTYRYRLGNSQHLEDLPESLKRDMGMSVEQKNFLLLHGYEVRE